MDRKENGPSVNKYEQNIEGVTIVNPTSDKAKDLVVGLQKSELEIAGNTQTVDAKAATIGILQRNLNGLSSRALVTYTGFKSQQEVLDNTTATGLSTFKGSYHSISTTLGTGSQLTRELGEGRSLKVNYDAEITHERVDDYSEAATFKWSTRNLVQAVIRSDAQWFFNTDDITYNIKAGVAYRNLFGGQTANYSIHNTNASFSGGNNSELTGTLGFGAMGTLQDGATVRVGLDTSTSNRETTSVVGSINFAWKF